MNYADIVTAEEMQDARGWLSGAVAALRSGVRPEAGKEPWFRFLYAGAPSAGLLCDWDLSEGTAHARDGAATHCIARTDPQTGLRVEVEFTDYERFPVVEWTVRLINADAEPTPVLSAIEAMDLSFVAAGHPVLHHWRGDTCGRNAYEPRQLVLEQESDYCFSPAGGRPTSLAFPYFNLSLGGERGVIIVLGWPGQWAARFTRDARDTVHVQAGQAATHLMLLPGETVRTPLAVLMFWRGDVVRAQNLWRRWMLAHNLPRRNGELHPPMSSQCGGLWQDEQGEKAAIAALARNGAALDYWWMDAGWWKEGFPTTGNWEPDTARFPDGIRPVSDCAHANGMKLVLWFEPERVSPGTPWAGREAWLLSIPPELHRERKDVVFSAPKFTVDEAERNQFSGGDRLLNLGNPQARRFLTDFLSARITEWGIDFLRIDFNFSPLEFWRTADGPDRQGMTENRYVTGLLAMLDELLARHPHLWIDTCASGGRRIDLETLRRALPLLRSDYQFEPVGNQAHTLGIASWIPYYGTGVGCEDVYEFRSSLAPAQGLGCRTDAPDWAVFRRRLQEWRRVVPYFLGDYYPLTSHSVRDDAWLAWQFDRADIGEGMVQAFRRAESPFTSARFPLRGLDAGATYAVTDLDSADEVSRIAGAELMGPGLPVRMGSAPHASVLVYRRQGKA